MNKSILITGANAGLGKETARQLALKPETEKIILACRNPERAEIAKKELEEQTGRRIFEILLVDISDGKSAKAAAHKIKDSVDAVILNAGGMGGRNPEKSSPSGMNMLSATNILGHVVLVEELLEQNKINNVVMLASSEAVRGIKKMGMKRPAMKTYSANEFASVLDGSYFGTKLDPNQAYGHVKYVATLWMSALARKYSKVKFVSMSPGATSGTSITSEMPLINKIMFKYIMMPVVMPMMGMIHGIDKGVNRYIDAISSDKFESGHFYASADGKVTGNVVDQSTIFPDLSNPNYQDNAAAAIHQFIN